MMQLLLGPIVTLVASATGYYFAAAAASAASANKPSQ
jgi:hypothetical protein